MSFNNDNLPDNILANSYLGLTTPATSLEYHSGSGEDEESKENEVLYEYKRFDIGNMLKNT